MTMDSNYIIELEEKVKAYQAEITKKDELIRKLSSIEISSALPTTKIQATDESGLKRAETATLMSRVETINEKALKQENEIKLNLLKISRLEQEEANYLGKISELERLNSKLSTQIAESDEKYCAANLAKSREAQRADELEKELITEREKLKQVEARLEYQTLEREKQQYEARKAEERLEYFVTQMIRIFDEYVKEDYLAGDSWKDEAKLSRLIEQANHVVNENLKQKGRIQDLSDRITERERQIAARDRTVDRLGQQLMQTCDIDREKEYLEQATHRDAKKERAPEFHVNYMKQDLMDAQMRIRELERQLAQAVHNIHHASEIHEGFINEKDFVMFKESLASILSTTRYPCHPTEVDIKEHARYLVTECNEQKEMCTRLETRLSELNARYGACQSATYDADLRLEDSKRENLSLRQKVQQLDDELATIQAIRNEQLMDKDRFFRFLCELATKAKIDHLIASRMKMDELQEMIMTRVGQIARGEFPLLNNVDAHADRVAGLTNKVKRLQDQLASKEVQLNLWRAKTCTLEERLTELEQVESQLEAERARVQSAIGREKRAGLENSKLRNESHRLKAELLDLTEAKARCGELQEIVEPLKLANEELQANQRCQAETMAQMVEDMNRQRDEMQRLRQSAEDNVNSITEQLVVKERTIEQLKRSETELFEFRALVGRLLGLDVRNLSVPSFDILTRLEQIIKGHKSLLQEETTLPVRERSFSPSRVCIHSQYSGCDSSNALHSATTGITKEGFTKAIGCDQYSETPALAVNVGKQSEQLMAAPVSKKSPKRKLDRRKY